MRRHNFEIFNHYRHHQPLRSQRKRMCVVLFHAVRMESTNNVSDNYDCRKEQWHYSVVWMQIRRAEARNHRI